MIKHNCIADILIVCSLLWIVLFCSQGCKKESTTQPNTNTTIGAPVSLQDRTLDLDGDNKVDFVFTYSAVTSNTYPSSATFFSLYTLGLDSNQVQNSSSGGTIPLQDGAQISDTSGWSNSSGSIAGATSPSHWYGAWITTNQRNLGLRLRRSGFYYYGWVKLSVDSTTGKFNIIDSSYNTKAGVPIFAGIHP